MVISSKNATVPGFHLWQIWTENQHCLFSQNLLLTKGNLKLNKKTTKTFSESCCDLGLRDIQRGRAKNIKLP